VRQHKTVDAFPGAERLTNEHLFALEVDVLIPAALENQITMENAPSIRAKVVVEGANGPTTPEAEEILRIGAPAVEREDGWMRAVAGRLE